MTIDEMLDELGENPELMLQALQSDDPPGFLRRALARLREAARPEGPERRNVLNEVADAVVNAPRNLWNLLPEPLQNNARNVAAAALPIAHRAAQAVAPLLETDQAGPSFEPGRLNALANRGVDAIERLGPERTELNPVVPADLLRLGVNALVGSDNPLEYVEGGPATKALTQGLLAFSGRGDDLSRALNRVRNGDTPRAVGAAFRHPQTGEWIDVGAAHDYDLLDPAIQDIVAGDESLQGFRLDDGTYLNRAEIAQLTGKPGESSVQGLRAGAPDAEDAPLPLLDGGSMPPARPPQTLLGAAADEPERVSQAAVKIGDRIFVGPNHGAATDAAVEALGMRNVPDKFDHGFVTSSGRYVDRDEAAQLAERARQIPEGRRRNVDAQGETFHLVSEQIGLPEYRRTQKGAELLGEPVPNRANQSDRRVAAAAIRTRDGRVFTGPNHGAALADMREQLGYGDTIAEGRRFSADFPEVGRLGDNGFVDTEGKWLTRQEAEELGRARGQIRTEAPRMVEGAHASDFHRGALQSATPPVRDYDAIDEGILARHREHGGATVDARTGEPVQNGYPVSIGVEKIFDHEPTPSEIAAFRREHAEALKDPDVRIGMGTWWDKDGVAHAGHELNLSRVFDDEREAIRFGRRHNQAAIGHIRDGVYQGDIAVPGNQRVREHVSGYLESSGVEPGDLDMVDAVDEGFAKRVADFYESAESTPNDPATIAAYRKFADEVRAQYEYLQNQGVKFEFVTEDPYKNSAEMMADVRENGRLKVFKTPDNHHPLLTPEENDQFRAVHDYFGHASEGNQFGPKGEENAFRKHVAMFSPEARRAMATETRAQNSWVNYGPHGEHNRANPAQTIFSDQKVLLMPEELIGEYTPPAAASAVPATSSAGAPALLLNPGATRDRGLFDLDLPDMQGTVPSDPRLLPPPPRTERAAQLSPVIQAIGENPEPVMRVLMRDAELGRHVGGDSWYNLAGLRAFIEGLGDPNALSFSDLNMLGAGGSASNSVHNELAAMSIMARMKRYGLTREQAVDDFRRATGWHRNVPIMGTHVNLGMGGIAGGGAILPTDPFGANWKVPSYGNMRQGGGGALDIMQPGSMPALDTHERRRIMQAVMADPHLRDVAETSGAVEASRKAKGGIPIRNALDYMGLSDLYIQGARNLDMATAGQFQAGRWLGGWDKTGLKSPPRGDFQQLLSDALLYTAQQRGLDDTPVGLRGLLGDVLRGDEFILPFMPTKREPYPTLRPQTRR